MFGLENVYYRTRKEEVFITVRLLFPEGLPLRLTSRLLGQDVNF